MFNKNIKIKKNNFFFNKYFICKNINIKIKIKKIKFNLSGKIFKWQYFFKKINFGVHFSHMTFLYFNFKKYLF